MAIGERDATLRLAVGAARRGASGRPARAQIRGFRIRMRALDDINRTAIMK